jgi:putative ABC transport system ATP-binding protein
VSRTPRTGRALLGRTLRRQRRRTAGFVGLLVVWQLCESLVPVVIGLTIDHGVATGEGETFVLWAALLVGLFVVLSYAYRFGSRVGMRAIETEVHQLRMEIAGHALDPRGLRADRAAGETMSLATSDAEEVGQALRMVAYAAASLAAVVVAAVVLLRIDLTLALVVLGGVPVCLALTQVATPLVSRRSRAQQERVAGSAGVAVDLVRGIRVLQGIGGEHAAAARYRAASREARDAGIKVAWARATLVGLAQLLGGVFLAVVTLLAGRLALQGDISIGELVAIVGLTQFLVEPITVLAEMSAQVATALASGQRIADFLGRPLVLADEPAPVGDQDDGEPGALELVGLGHGSLTGVDLRSPPGELLGIVAADPADAQALVRVLAAQVPADEVTGEIRLGGVPVSALDVDTRRARLVVAPHRADLLEGSLHTNVDPWQRHPDHRLVALLSASAADDVVALRADGLGAEVTAEGTTYSGGQRQRIALARALASEAPVLVLHDPTTAVDSVTEGRIARGLREVREGHTTWLLTSSPALLEVADRVVVLRRGRVVADGTHHTLMDDADYQDLVVR